MDVNKLKFYEYANWKKKSTTLQILLRFSGKALLDLHTGTWLVHRLCDVITPSWTRPYHYMTCRVQFSVYTTTERVFWILFSLCKRTAVNKHQCQDADDTHVFMKVTAYMARGVQTIGWSVRMALMALSTQCSGFSGGKNGAISFLRRRNEYQQRLIMNQL